MRQEGPTFRTRDRRVRPLQTKNQNVALLPQPDATHAYEIDSPSKRPAASVPLSTRGPPISIISPRLLTEVIPYEGGPWPTFSIAAGERAAMAAGTAAPSVFAPQGFAVTRAETIACGGVARSAKPHGARAPSAARMQCSRVFSVQR